MRKFYYIALVLLLFLLSSCAKEKEIEEKPQDQPIVYDEVEAPVVIEPVEVPPEEEVVVVKPEVSFTTGLPCTLDEKLQRPIAVMYNNNKVSFPQSEISKADIVYECDAEGGMTRLMAVFSDWKNLDVIGSVRSARDYFVSLSESHGAIFVNAGGSPMAYEKLINTKVDYVDGVNMNFLPKNTFYRDNDRIRNCGYEHSMVTTSKKLIDAIDFLGYETQYPDTFSASYTFNSDLIKPEGKCAELVSLRHSIYITVDFKFDSNNNKYYKYSFGKPHIDGANEEQLAFENILILFVKEKVLDDEGRLEVDLTSGGDGYYITSGSCVPIKWMRASDNSPFTFTYDGQPLSLNKGKTHITLFNKNHSENVIIE